MSHDERAGLAAFNAVPAEAVREALMSCCSSSRWAESVMAGRPYASLADLLRQSGAATEELGIADLDDALSGHPRIGDRQLGDQQPGGHQQDDLRDEGQDADGDQQDGDRPDPSWPDGDQPDANRQPWSREEQAGMDQATPAARQALAEGNRGYEQRFGHIYLVCATGRSADELLRLLRQRLANDPETEWRVVRTELAKINEIRLRKLIGGAQ